VVQVQASGRAGPEGGALRGGKRKPCSDLLPMGSRRPGERAGLATERRRRRIGVVLKVELNRTEKHGISNDRLTVRAS